MSKKKQSAVRKKNPQQQRAGQLAEKLNRSAATTQELVANYNAVFLAKAGGGSAATRQFEPRHQS